jgi:glycosyltransferase involved in cell wall biosynthesis
MVILEDLNFLDKFAISNLKNNHNKIDLLIFPELNRRNYFFELIGGISYYKSIIIPNSNNQKKCFDFELNNAPIIVGHVGAIGENHHILNYLEAIKLLSNNNIEFWFIGNIIPEIKIKIENINNDKVKVFNQIPHDQLINYYKKMDLGVILYKDVSLNFRFCAPNKLYEYWSFGVPVVGDFLIGLVDLNFENHMGKLIDMSNKLDFVDFLNNLKKTSEPEKRRIFNTFEEKYSLDSQMINFKNSLGL